MTKPKVRQEIEPQEARQLNMEEKRKLEKLLSADIESATARYDIVTQEERQALIEKLGKLPCRRRWRCTSATNLRSNSASSLKPSSTSSGTA
jgi:hypothetical protein